MWLFMIKIFLPHLPIEPIWSSSHAVRPYVCIVLSPPHAIFVPSLPPSFLLLWDLLPFSTFKFFSVSIQTAPSDFTLASQPEWVGLEQGGKLSIGTIGTKNLYTFFTTCHISCVTCHV